MNINTIHENGKIIFALEGILNTETSPQLHDILIPAFDKASEVKLDFSQVEYIYSAGLRVLMIGQKSAIARGIPMIITNVSEEVMEIFTTSAFDKILTIK